VISTAPRSVWSIHTPSGPGAAMTAGKWSQGPPRWVRRRA
jgi:hypothetical protein